MRRENGEGGIRTRGPPKADTGFRDRLDQPLRHLSECKLSIFNCQLSMPNTGKSLRIRFLPERARLFLDTDLHGFTWINRRARRERRDEEYKERFLCGLRALSGKKTSGLGNLWFWALLDTDLHGLTLLERRTEDGGRIAVFCPLSSVFWLLSVKSVVFFYFSVNSVSLRLGSGQASVARF